MGGCGWDRDRDWGGDLAAEVERVRVFVGGEDCVFLLRVCAVYFWIARGWEGWWVIIIIIVGVIIHE